MALNAKKAPKSGGGGPRVEQPLLEPGPYPARVVQVLDLGVQPQQPYQGQEKPPAHMLSITYELLDAFMVDESGVEQEDKPRWISEEFALRNLEADLATSTKRYKAIDPDEDFDGDFTQLVNMPCTVTVGHKKVASGKNAGRTFEKVMNVAAMRARDAANAPELQGTVRVFVLDDPDMEVFNALPEWLQNKIKGNLEYAGSPLATALGDNKGKPAVRKDKPAPKPADQEDDNGDGEEPQW